MTPPRLWVPACRFPELVVGARLGAARWLTWPGRRENGKRQMSKGINRIDNTDAERADGGSANRG
jgi:hypothetical protein